MAIPLYLAKTAAEFASTAAQPEKLAWMACHFSLYGTGLTNIPSALPKGSLLILNDRTPVHGHDPVRIRETLEEAVEKLSCSGVLLDFQRSDCPETEKIVKELLSLPCPVCVSEIYANDLDCPVFLPPVPLTVPIEEQLAPWQKREIWLEAAKSSCQYTVTEKGSRKSILDAVPDSGFRDEVLHCHYRVCESDDSIVFSLWRSHQDLAAQVKAAEGHGVTAAVGLWQELKAHQ